MGNDTNVNIGNSGEYFVAGELKKKKCLMQKKKKNKRD